MLTQAVTDRSHYGENISLLKQITLDTGQNQDDISLSLLRTILFKLSSDVSGLFKQPIETHNFSFQSHWAL